MPACATTLQQLSHARFQAVQAAVGGKSLHADIQVHVLRLTGGHAGLMVPRLHRQHMQALGLVTVFP